MSAVPAGEGRERPNIGRLFRDNPAIVLTFVFIGLFVITDIVNRAQNGHAFLTPKQFSTTFLYAAVLGLIAAGQTLVMLTGGVGGLVGPIAAAFVLTLVKTILILKGVDQNWAQVIQGAIIVGVMMVGGWTLRQKGKTGG